MVVSPARQAAFAILLRVERESAFAVELLHSSLLDGLSPADRNLAMEIVMGVLRWRSLLDQAIARLSFTPFRKLDLEVVTALRMGAYQKQFLSKIPSHAAVNETVELVKAAKKTSAAGLVNAVMRKMKRGLESNANLIDVESIASWLAHPKWLVERWEAHFGLDTARRICEYDQRIPRTTLRLSSPEDETGLAREGIELAPGALMANARIVIGGDAGATEAFRAGRVAIQDEGSQLVAALVGPGKRILDCCAAPGGKTAALATRLPEAEIFAAELHPHRARLLRTMAPQPNVHVVTADALVLPFTDEFDRVLADVPCSGTGTLARNPEIKWRLRPEDLHDLASRQKAILSAAMGHVAAGGRMIYSTCSLEPEENQQVVTACLRDHAEFRVVPVQEELAGLQRNGELVWQEPGMLVDGNYLRTIPGVQPCDGFFAAVLQRH
jgi:16S rRNA (cytosine967-C5)-methyltransferase